MITNSPDYISPIRRVQWSNRKTPKSTDRETRLSGRSLALRRSSAKLAIKETETCKMKPAQAIAMWSSLSQHSCRLDNKGHFYIPCTVYIYCTAVLCFSFPSNNATGGSFPLHATGNKATSGSCCFFSLFPAFSAVFRVKIYSIA